jgi:hypothetical protein
VLFQQLANVKKDNKEALDPLGAAYDALFRVVWRDLAVGEGAQSPVV